MQKRVQMQKRLLLVFGLAVLTAVGFTVFEATDLAANPGCMNQGFCVGTGCVPIPTSLPTANGGRAASIGWEPNGGACGTKSCYVVFRCACGAPLSTQWCDGCPWPPECV